MKDLAHVHHLIVYSADFHGNVLQYKKLVRFATGVSADSIVIGGDIAPKRGNRKNFISLQRDFLSKKLPGLLHPFKKALPDSQIFLIMGNDDCACNLDILERHDRELFNLLHGRRLDLAGEFDIVGYSFIPITPFMLKDWEKFDLSEAPQTMTADYAHRKSSNYRLEGFRSALEGWREFHFTEAMETEESIQRDLGAFLLTDNPQNTIYVFHAPPDNTSLDLRYDGRHVGSMAIRLFIEEHQPYLTLHGHIHETVDVSGSYKDIIGDSVSLSSGNHDLGNYSANDLAVLLFNLSDVESAQRRII